MSYPEMIKGSADEVFRRVLDELLNSKAHWVLKSAPRGMKTSEILNVSLEYDFSEESPFCTRYLEPNVRRYFAWELAWYLSGSSKLEDILGGSSFQKKASNDGIHLNSAYGARLMGQHPQRILTWPEVSGGVENYMGHKFDQLKYCVELLYRDPDSRRAVAVILERQDTFEDELLQEKGTGSNDVPCTIAIHWFVRKDKLHQIVTMRSNDVWRGFVYDVPCFAFIHGVMLSWLNEMRSNGRNKSLELGKYWHNVHSLHMYDRWTEQARSMLASSYNDSVYDAALGWDGFHKSAWKYGIAAHNPPTQDLMGANPWPMLYRWRHLEKERWTWE